MNTEKQIQKQIITDTELNHVDYNLVVANGLIEANHNLVLNENKLLNAVMAQISMYDTEIKEFEFTTKQLQEICNLNPLHIKRTLDKIRKNLLKKTFTLKDEIKRDGEHEEVTAEYNWIRYIKYNDNRWLIRLSDDLAPLLLNLKKEFTAKRLQELQTYENLHAQRLDMIFTMYFNRRTSKMSFDNKIKYKTKISYSLTEFKKMFGLEEKYTDYNNFYRFVLKPAIEEINNKGYFSVSFEKKNGLKNKCEGIILFFSLGEKTIHEIQNREISDSQKMIKLLCCFSYSKKEAEKMLNTLDIEEIKNIFTNLAKQKENMTNEEQIQFVKDNIEMLQNDINKNLLLDSLL